MTDKTAKARQIGLGLVVLIKMFIESSDRAASSLTSAKQQLRVGEPGKKFNRSILGNNRAVKLGLLRLSSMS